MFQAFIFVALISLSYGQRPSFLPTAVISCVADGNHVSYHRDLFIGNCLLRVQAFSLNFTYSYQFRIFTTCSALPITIVVPQIVQQVDVQQATPYDRHP